MYTKLTPNSNRMLCMQLPQDSVKNNESPEERIERIFRQANPSQ